MPESMRMAERGWRIRTTEWVAVLACVLLPGASSCAQNSSSHSYAASGTKYRISGTILNSIDGAPLGSARVSLLNRANPANALSMITSETGRFEFGPLPAGKFHLEGAKRGFLGGGYQQHEQFSTAIVTGAGFETENLVLRLTPLAVLGGKVFDEVGEPVREGRVRLFFESNQGGTNRVRPRGFSMTNDEGSFEFTDLRPGKYYVAVSAKPWYAVYPPSRASGDATNSSPTVAPSLDVAYPTTFYNGATDSDGATPIVIRGGDHAEADIHISPVPALHLLIRFSPDQQQRMPFPMLQRRMFDTPEMVDRNGVNQVAPGVYELLGVPAGRYSVRSRSQMGLSDGEAKEVDLEKNGQELEGAPPSEPGGTIRVSVKMARGGVIPSQINLMLRDSRQRVVHYQTADSGGSATFNDVAPGTYAMLVNVPTENHPFTIARISSQDTEKEGHDITVTAGASLDLTASLVPGVVSIEGFAGRQGKTMPGVMIALVPKDPEMHPERFRRDQSDMDGSFQIAGVLPGSYTLIAVEDAWDFAWNQPAALARYVQHGQSLTIGELMNGTVYLPEPVEVQPR
jgi:uncharacterized protein (DUF2141 family)